MSQAAIPRKFKTLSLNRDDSFFYKYGFGFLNFTQFLGALNDNLFKFLTTFLLISLQGAAASNDILIFIGIAFVLPFILFSSTGGILADRFSKQKVIVLLKAFEVVIITSSFIAYHYKYSWMCYALVFLLSMQSALMTPSKYSIIPEIVRKDQIPKANGMLTSFTYIAIILGSFFASLITDMTGGNFIVANFACLFASIIGFITSLYIPHTKSKAAKEKISPLFVKQVVKTLKYCRRTPRLILVICCSAFFLFIAGFLQLNIIPFALETLHISEVHGGYLFSMTSIGIALGAVFGGRACKKEVDLGLSCFALIAIGFISLLIPIFATKLVSAAIALTLLGFFGGMFVVPMESYLQAFSSSEVRGQVIATQNFLSFFGVLLAPVCLALFGKVLGISAVTGFALLGVIILMVVGFMLKYLAGSFLHFMSKRFFQPFIDLHFIKYPFGPQYLEDKIAIVCKKKSLWQIALLLGESSKIHVFLVKSKKHRLHKVISFFSNIDYLYTDLKEKPDPLFIQTKMDKIPFAVRPLFVFSDQKSREHFEKHTYFERLRSSLHYQTKYFSVKNISYFKPSASKPLKRIQMTVAFKAHNKKILTKKEPLLLRK